METIPVFSPKMIQKLPQLHLQARRTRAGEAAGGVQQSHHTSVVEVIAAS